MQLSSKQVILDYLRGQQFATVLDAPSGNGWLAEGLAGRATLDGIDLYATAPGYRRIWQHDLDDPLPADCGSYDLICCCEGLEHVGNPLLLLRTFHQRLARQRPTRRHHAESVVSAGALAVFFARFLSLIPMPDRENHSRHAHAHHALVVAATLSLLKARGFRRDGTRSRADVQGKASV